jgi:hypothetical protein
MILLLLGLNKYYNQVGKMEQARKPSTNISIKNEEGRLVFLNALPLNSIPKREFSIRCHRVSPFDIIDIAKDSEIENYIRHEGTTKLLSSLISREIKPSVSLYSYQPGDQLLIITLKKPVRGQEATEVSIDDIDTIYCEIGE